MENLNGIDTVDDLLRIQKGKPATTKELVKELCSPIFNETPGIGIECIDTLICGMIELHSIMVETMTDQGEDPALIKAWQVDLSRLEIAQELLDSIRL
jgi:hypothetical protein